MFKFNCVIPRIFLKIQGIKYGRHLKMVGWPAVFKFPNSSITIGDNVTVNSNFWSNLLGLYQRTIIVAKKSANISIGNNVGMSGCTIYSREKITIGDDTLIGANTKIVDNDFHPIDSTTRKQNKVSDIISRPVIIGNNVFIGMNVIILKGTIVGDDCVIGAGSVVSGQYEEGCIIAGNPAKVIRRVQKNSI